MARILKFWILVEEVLYFPYSENKGMGLKFSPRQKSWEHSGLSLGYRTPELEVFGLIPSFAMLCL